jgi:hypothetical protein
MDHKTGMVLFVVAWREGIYTCSVRRAQQVFTMSGVDLFTASEKI